MTGSLTPPEGRRIHTVWCLPLLLPLAACSGGEEARGQPAPNGPRPTLVAVAPATRADLVRTVTVTGPVEPMRTIGVTSQTTGTLLHVHVQEGDRVRAGQVLAELDGRETRAQLERAEALLGSARTAWERAEQLHGSGIVTDAERDAARTTFEVARADVALWRTRVSFTRIAAPAAGTVITKLVEAGSSVSTNQRLFDLADDSLLVVRVQVSELDVVHLRPGLAIVVSLDAYPEAAIDGRIRRIFPSADPATRLVPVEVALGRGGAGVVVRPGFLARVSLPVERRANALTVPAAAAATASGTTAVFVVDADTLVQRPVTFGLASGGRLEVLDGLAEGDRVVVSGIATLRPGQRVRVQSGEPR